MYFLKFHFRSIFLDSFQRKKKVKLYLFVKDILFWYLMKWSPILM